MWTRSYDLAGACRLGDLSTLIDTIEQRPRRAYRTDDAIHIERCVETHAPLLSNINGSVMSYDELSKLVIPKHTPR